MKGLWCFLVLLWPLPASAALSNTIHIYVYHDFPPYEVRSDATFGLSEFFVQKIQDTFPKKQFILHNTPKPVILEKIENQKSLIILWVNPLWFRKYQEQLVFTDAIIWDSDHLLSRADTPVPYKGEASLYGKTQCSLHGHFYHFIDAAIKSGKVAVHNEERMPACVSAINKGLADYVVIDKSAWLNMFTSSAKKKYYLSHEAVDSFSRGALLTKDLAPLLPALNKAIKSLRHSKDWQDKMKAIGGGEFLDLFNLDLFEIIELQGQP